MLTSSYEEAKRAVPIAQAYIKRQNFVASRIEAMSRQSEIAEIKQAVEAEVDDLAARKNISDKVDEIARRQDELAERLRFSGDAFADEMRKVDLKERKLKMRRDLLEREPAAVLVGPAIPDDRCAPGRDVLAYSGA